MRFISTNKIAPPVDLKSAIFHGIASDGGLFLPETLPKFTLHQINQCKNLQEISFLIAESFCRDTIDPSVLKMIIKTAFNYPITLKEIHSDVTSLELFHGPTLSFKDFGARFMAQLVEKILPPNKQMIVLVATSGDTGSALGRAFHKMKNVFVKILFAKDRISFLQKKQLTTIGDNVKAYEVEGTFDDCQSLVNQSLNDNDLRNNILVTTGNSINVARLIPQSFYYFEAYRRLQPTKPFVISIPSGNFGHLISALLAKKMGLPINLIIGATNINDTVPQFLHSGNYSPHPSCQTISNSMDVGNPSNFPRLLSLYQENLEEMRKDIYGVSFTDEETRKVISRVFQKTGTILDPHSAIGYLAIEQYKKNTGNSDIEALFCSTAHPSKFASVIEQIIEREIEMPFQLQEILQAPSISQIISSSYPEFKKLLQHNHLKM